MEEPVEDKIASQLDDEIAALRSQIKSLKARRAVQTTNIFSSTSSESTLARLQSADPSESNPLQPIFDHSKKQLSHNQECLYRTCAGITAFRVQDPDPHAVDSGKVLGLRFEVFGNGKFLRPYYVFLNKPYAGSQILRVHRHTVPPCIPLATLAKKYLPTPAADVDVMKAKKQDLSRFVRSLRREVAAYHNRVSAIAAMRKAFGLETKKGKDKGNDKGKSRELVVRDVTAVDAEVKQMRIEWVDGRVGRVVMDDKGNIVKSVIIGDHGRDREMETKIRGGNGRVEGLADRILS